MAKISLEFPVISNGVTVDALQMRRPKVKDQLAADKTSGSDAAKEIRLFADLCEVTPSVVEDLDMIDYGQLQKTYRGFLSSARQS